MAVVIRFSRVGRKNRAFFRIVAADSRFKRDGRFLEKLGTYDPLEHKLISLNSEKVQYWKSVGAKLSDSVLKVLKNYAS